jgi:hypothetical protein
MSAAPFEQRLSPSVDSGGIYAKGRRQLSRGLLAVQGLMGDARFKVAL